MPLRRSLTLVLLAVCLAWAQAGLTIDQLTAFIRSSILLRHPDKQVAAYLARITLRERLDDRTVEELQGLGAGAKTVEALRTLRDSSQALPVPVAKAPPPVVAAPAPPSAGEQRKILDETRDYALNYSKSLPDFICTQVTRRYVDPTGLEFWRAQDVLTTRLSYFEQKENYKLVMVNNQYTELPFESVGGTTSTGEFGSLLKEIFEHETETSFQWDRWATLRGRRAHVFSYKVTQPRSKWHVNYEKTMDIIVGYSGLIYVDRDTGMVLRVVMEAEDIPVTFPVRAAGTVLDYDFTKIAEREFLLPLRSVVRLRKDKFLSKNEVEFRLYRKFAAETTITYTPDPLPEDQTKEQPPAAPPATQK